MTDIEIAMWSLLIEKKASAWDEFDLPIALLMTGFQAKVRAAASIRSSSTPGKSATFTLAKCAAYTQDLLKGTGNGTKTPRMRLSSTQRSSIGFTIALER
eukprot:TRINITY_DN8697_c0_g2_i2.p2 TRINITY_DN8697_c0_g2~~TRINITY_DN8697_c0_g2_i2.p2  ORF type:complete len:100 (+),score=17.45 TRINITY_DN8697_c0_g2_i2:532-831(+)